MKRDCRTVAAILNSVQVAMMRNIKGQAHRAGHVDANASVVINLDGDLRVKNGSPGSGHLFHLVAGKPLPMDAIERLEDRRLLQSALKAAVSSGDSSGELQIRFSTSNERAAAMTVKVLPLYRDLSCLDGAMLVVRESSPPSSSRGATVVKSQIKAIHMPESSQTLIESIPEGVFTIDLKWRIISFNREAEAITGFSKTEALGRRCWEIFRSDMCSLNCPLRKAIEQGRSYMDQDVRMIRKGGEALTILVNAGLVKTRTGKVIGAVETFRPLVDHHVPGNRFEKSKAFSGIIGKSASMHRLFAMLADVAVSDTNVLISGESGTGKELVARTLHDQSQRSGHPFLAVNCSALAESLLESELFGHEKAAFTGAASGKIGRFELAGDGTLFLDEIGDLKPQLQVKLLRVLEQREFERVGGTCTLPMKARIISATNRDLREAMGQGDFREDLFYRLRTVPLTIPPLRHRLEDIPLLVDHFIQRLNHSCGKRVQRVDDAVMEVFMNHHWPGNVRELERTLEYAFVFIKGPVILPAHLPAPDEFSIIKEFGDSGARSASRRPTREAILRALTSTDGARSAAARHLGISRTSLWRHMKTFDIK